MRITVTAYPGARENFVEQTSETEYKVYTREPPVQGRANRAITRLLAEHFAISPVSVYLKTGFASRKKVFELELNS